MKKLFLFLLIPFYLLAQEINLPQPYRELIQKLDNFKGKYEIKSFGGKDFSITVEVPKNGGYLITTINQTDFLSFYRELLKTFSNQKMEEVSIQITLNNETLPYNPFYQLWDADFGINLLNFSKLKPGCKGEVIKLKAEKVIGIKVLVPYSEVKKLFEGTFKYPSFYCP